MTEKMSKGQRSWQQVEVLLSQSPATEGHALQGLPERLELVIALCDVLTALGERLRDFEDYLTAAGLERAADQVGILALRTLIAGHDCLDLIPHLKE